MVAALAIAHIRRHRDYLRLYEIISSYGGICISFKQIRKKNNCAALNLFGVAEFHFVTAKWITLTDCSIRRFHPSHVLSVLYTRLNSLPRLLQS